MDGLVSGLDGLVSGSDARGSDSGGLVLGLDGHGLAMDSDGRLVFTADRFSEGLSGVWSEALYSIRTCTEVSAIRTEAIRISINESKRAPLQGPFYIGQMS